MSGISPKLPLTNSKVNGAYELNQTIRETISQNLKNLLLTTPGERVMDPAFGVGLHAHLFENFSSTTIGNIKNNLIRQVEKYMPFIEVLDVSTSRGVPALGESDQLLKIQVEFFIKPLDATDILIINSDSN